MTMSRSLPPPFYTVWSKTLPGPFMDKLNKIISVIFFDFFLQRNCVHTINDNADSVLALLTTRMRCLNSRSIHGHRIGVAIAYMSYTVSV